jgi:hypothetical protein
VCHCLIQVLLTMVFQLMNVFFINGQRLSERTVEQRIEDHCLTFEFC